MVEWCGKRIELLVPSRRSCWRLESWLRCVAQGSFTLRVNQWLKSLKACRGHRLWCPPWNWAVFIFFAAVETCRWTAGLPPNSNLLIIVSQCHLLFGRSALYFWQDGILCCKTGRNPAVCFLPYNFNFRLKYKYKYVHLSMRLQHYRCLINHNNLPCFLTVK